MKKLLIAALALSCSTAFAGNAYVGVGVGSATQKFSDSGINLSENSTAVDINAGYQFTPMFGAEVGYFHFGEATVKGGGFTIGAKPKSFYLAGTATFPVSPAFGVFVKAGAVRTDTNVFGDNGTTRESEDKSGNSAMFGIGASYAFTPKMSAILEYGNFGTVLDEDGSKLKVSHVSAGLRFSF
ncbi:MAG: outer membrane beta-barrel protein [Pseudomonadota bacterium]|nr:outer membrane beta-barrel protein [Pseudomonadota bacterium]